jgi:hypothetical protein
MTRLECSPLLADSEVTRDTAGSTLQTGPSSSGPTTASLLEGLVWGSRAARVSEGGFHRREVPRPTQADEVPRWDETGLVDDPDPALIQRDMQIIHNLL